MLFVFASSRLLNNICPILINLTGSFHPSDGRLWRGSRRRGVVLPLFLFFFRLCILPHLLYSSCWTSANSPYISKGRRTSQEPRIRVFQVPGCRQKSMRSMYVLWRDRVVSISCRITSTARSSICTRQRMETSLRKCQAQSGEAGCFSLLYVHPYMTMARREEVTWAMKWFFRAHAKC